ncbi:MAG: DapH/DapD/GlmU-related protein [Candidatus Binatia bacterium]
MWIDNLARVSIGTNCCVSQDAYLCTGNHDRSRSDFRLLTEEIVIEDRVWIGARAVIGPGVRIGEGARIGLGRVVTRDVSPSIVLRAAAGAASDGDGRSG